MGSSTILFALLEHRVRITQDLRSQYSSITKALELLQTAPMGKPLHPFPVLKAPLDGKLLSNVRINLILLLELFYYFITLITVTNRMLRGGG